ncbi:uncharacterized protein LOC118492323 [Helianthus annuus]|uniref:uncharacterized protein LOC118492323 n=1 Tax=Helianthus annuus TaxID=4232 RepID=UPI001652D4F6|nr:uncharacterized protein LOC118492323 [Helianthus annuus]
MYKTSLQESCCRKTCTKQVRYSRKSGGEEEPTKLLPNEDVSQLASTGFNHLHSKKTAINASNAEEVRKSQQSFSLMNMFLNLLQRDLIIFIVKNCNRRFKCRGNASIFN